MKPVILMPGEKHVAYGLHRVQAVGDVYTYALLGGVEISGVGHVVLIVERRYYLERLHSEIGHAVAVERYVDYLCRTP